MSSELKNKEQIQFLVKGFKRATTYGVLEPKDPLKTIKGVTGIWGSDDELIELSDLVRRFRDVGDGSIEFKHRVVSVDNDAISFEREELIAGRETPASTRAFTLSYEEATLISDALHLSCGEAPEAFLEALKQHDELTGSSDRSYEFPSANKLLTGAGATWIKENTQYLQRCAFETP